jgi:hypothetical protein
VPSGSLPCSTASIFRSRNHGSGRWRRPAAQARKEILRAERAETCPSDAMSLVKMDREVAPPPDRTALYRAPAEGR